MGGVFPGEEREIISLERTHSKFVSSRDSSLMFHGPSFGSRERYQQVRRIGVYPRPYRKTMDKKDVVSNLGSSKDPIINKLLLLHSAP